MPDFNTFRINENLVGRLYAIRKIDTCLDNLTINDPKYNKNIKCKTTVPKLFDTFKEWNDYIHNSNVINLDKLDDV